MTLISTAKVTPTPLVSSVSGYRQKSWLFDPISKFESITIRDEVKKTRSDDFYLLTL